jgi:hypothetical protein
MFAIDSSWAVSLAMLAAVVAFGTALVLCRSRTGRRIEH